MYNIIMYFVEFGVWLAHFFDHKVRLMWRGELDSFRVLREKVDPNASYVWFHAASLGEFEQGRPLMEALRREHPEYKILLTFYSPSGYEVRKNYAGADIVCYMPVDTVSNARRFLRTVRPVMAFFIKYEFWYNFLHILRHRGVPTYSVSSIFRPGQVFFRWYGRQYGRVLRCFTHFFVQNQVSKDLLHGLGLDNTTITGDTRFDRVLEIAAQAKSLPIVEAFSENQKVLVAGSSWPPDEEIIIDYLNQHPDWRLILAPHVVSEEHISWITARLKMATVRYTQSTAEQARQARCLIIDCYGLLSSIYHYATVAYVGGGFGVGIHNVLEAAVWGKPVIFGPNNKRFDEAQGLILSGGGFEISGAEDFAKVLGQLADDGHLSKSSRAARQYVESKAGATRTIMSMVNDKLK